MCSRATSLEWIRSEMPHSYSLAVVQADIGLWLTVEESQHVRGDLDPGTDFGELDMLIPVHT